MGSVKEHHWLSRLISTVNKRKRSHVVCRPLRLFLSENIFFKCLYLKYVLKASDWFWGRRLFVCFFFDILINLPACNPHVCHRFFFLLISVLFEIQKFTFHRGLYDVRSNLITIHHLFLSPTQHFRLELFILALICTVEWGYDWCSARPFNWTTVLDCVNKHEGNWFKWYFLLCCKTH